MKQIDTRGLSCPQPVVLVLAEIRNGKGEFEVLIDSEASRENVKRLLNKNKLEFNMKEISDHTIYHVKR
ncbi:MAG: sulfurtransferase TusA family protein [Candidatus Cloacimonetes bacterium]|jgi:tRNA 2-thiouridine synthesizing protein A|nr:sulfurtransferase TusA family protein [Candidatus Cloacimonadota bacterium]